MWNEVTQADYEHSGLQFASDMTDRKWALIASMLPRRKPLGRPRTTDLHEVVNALLYMLRSGCPCHPSPKDFPPRSTLHLCFYACASMAPGNGSATNRCRPCSPQSATSFALTGLDGFGGVVAAFEIVPDSRAWAVVSGF